ASAPALALVPRLELEADLAVGLPHEVSGERPAGASRNELQQVGLAGGEELLHLLAFDRALENDAPRAEVASLSGSDRALAHVSGRHLEHPSAAFRAGTEGLLAAEIRRFGRGSAVGAVAEIKLNLVHVIELEARGEGPADLAAEALERADRALLEQCVGFRDFELAARDDLPHPEIARLALEFLVVLV